MISIHALLAESDGDLYPLGDGLNNFYPRSPCGERLDGGRALDLRGGISIHALLAESDSSDRRAKMDGLISIHALLAESDVLTYADGTVEIVISIHALLAESDPSRPPASRLLQPFLSTLSLRRATAPQQENGQAATISIHALLAESDHPDAGSI